jgi:hypothetical protein
MKDNNLEKQFREGLKGLEAGPPDGSKDAIEKHLLDAGLLKEKADTRGGLWMFVLLALLIATPVVYALRKTHVIQLADNAAHQNAIEHDLNNAVAPNANEHADASASITTNSTPAQNVKSNTALPGELSSKNKKIHLNKVLAYDKALVRNHNKITRKAEDTKAKPNDIQPAIILSDNSTTDLTANAQVAEQGASNSDANAASSNDNSNANPEADKTDIKEDTLAEKKHTALKDTTAHPKLPVEKIHKEIAFDFSGAPQFNTITYGNGAEHCQPYIEESRRSEKEIPSFSAAFGIVMSLNKYIIETGIKHSILTTDFSYQENLTTIDTSRSHFGTLGWVHIEDSVEKTTHYIATNKIAFMEFPLLMGYRIRTGKFEFELKTGPLMSFITSANTTVISLNTGVVLQSNDLDNSPYRKTCWSILSAGNILYSFGGRFSAFVQPSWKSGITGIFKESAPVTKKVQTVSVGIGVRVKL